MGRPKIRTPEQLAAMHRKSWLKRLYGITPEEYDELLEEQGGLCAVCHEPEKVTNIKGELRRLAVDHDHLTGRVRGLLCLQCNTAVGAIERVGLPAFARYLAA